MKNTEKKDLPFEKRCAYCNNPRALPAYPVCKNPKHQEYYKEYRELTRDNTIWPFK